MPMLSDTPILVTGAGAHDQRIAARDAEGWLAARSRDGAEHRRPVGDGCD